MFPLVSFWHRYGAELRLFVILEFTLPIALNFLGLTSLDKPNIHVT